MIAALDSDYIGALLRSETFTPVLWTGSMLGVALIGLVVWLARRFSHRFSWRTLHTDVSGAATIVDFTLTFPIVLVILFFIIQLIIMLNGALIVHYAAYAAARSARVWLWDSTPWPSGVGLGPVVDRLRDTPVARAHNNSELQRRVEQAARFALIAASPADERLSSFPVNIPEHVLQQMAQVAGYAGRAAVLQRKARYAFDPQNSHVTVDYEQGSNEPEMLLDLFKSADAWAVTTTVSFRLHLAIPVARFLGVNRGDGQYYRAVTAKVTLL